MMMHMSKENKETKMKFLYRVHYRMQIQGGGDIWRVCGLDENDKIKWLSTPIEFDENTDVLKTFSGSVYKS